MPLQVEYLAAENRILKAHLRNRLRLTRDERSTLGEIGKRLGRKGLERRAGYVPLAEVGAELLFQVIADRAKKTAVIITTNLPFSELPQVFPNAPLCKAMMDRMTDRAHIIETGTESLDSAARLQENGWEVIRHCF